MDFIRDLAKALAELDRLSRRYDDRELSEVVQRVMEQMGALIEILGRLSGVYEEMEIIMKGLLRLDTPVLHDIELKDGEDLPSFFERARGAGADPNRVLAYLLGINKAKLSVEGQRVVIRLRR
ncbi:hypothetical protein [Thermoproteus tenax]|uniref:Uncharacterized protein n=1 Tax=Thermoproteus tenax (strain ATCC 35583 / DSM 2078 / JCM 9277 / NBRC 100435 / Kra 1) TaxID=768679 RepID=G4RNW2_THETK|nr:hypothetical protein [Thermoproteus tenax]CCC81256.1 hypothetical protein TTX_0593 [Thermoproteus tenax Kra 1]